MIYIIANCTNSKKILPSDTLILENYCFKSIEKSLIDWERNIISSKSNMTIADKLYKGHSWQEILKSKEILSKKFNTQLLISSAGYGLINSNKKITSYQASFSKSTTNSIHKFKNDSLLTPTIIWWDKINNFEISELEKNSYIFITVSYEYLIAMQNTIKELIDIFGDKVFIIVLSKEKLPIFYNDNILRFDTRFNTFEKGTITSIIPRFSKWLFKEIVEHNIELNHKFLQNYIDNFLSKFSNYIIPIRKQLTDDEISNIIKKQTLSKSKGLRDLRLQGYACSQDRYGKLYTKIKGKNNG